MQRLTERADEYFHKGGIRYYPKERGINQAVYNKLGEYEDLEEQGLLLRLPCKVGDVVYATSSPLGFTDKKVHDIKVRYIGIAQNYAFISTSDKYGGMLQFEFSEIGKILFLTKEEAEAKLREMEAGE